LRLGTPNHEALRILITSRTYDWDKTVAGPIRQRFVAVGCPELATHETSAVGDEFGAFLAALREPLRSIVMARPLLLRLGFELWLRRSSESLPPDETINDLPSELALWLKYYEEVVCTPDVGPTSSITSGDVRNCHDGAARAQVQGDFFGLAFRADPLEQVHPRAFPWLLSLEG